MNVTTPAPFGTTVPRAGRFRVCSTCSCDSAGVPIRTASDRLTERFVNSLTRSTGGTRRACTSASGLDANSSNSVPCATSRSASGPNRSTAAWSCGTRVSTSSAAWNAHKITSWQRRRNSAGTLRPAASRSCSAALRFASAALAPTASSRNASMWIRMAAGSAARASESRCATAASSSRRDWSRHCSPRATNRAIQSGVGLRAKARTISRYEGSVTCAEDTWPLAPAPDGRRGAPPAGAVRKPHARKHETMTAAAFTIRRGA